MEPDRDGGHMKQTLAQEFQWSLMAVLAHAQDMCSAGSYKKKQTQMLHEDLTRQWRKLRDELETAMGETDVK